MYHGSTYPRRRLHCGYSRACIWLIGSTGVHIVRVAVAMAIDEDGTISCGTVESRNTQLTAEGQCVRAAPEIKNQELTCVV